MELQAPQNELSGAQRVPSEHVVAAAVTAVVLVVGTVASACGSGKQKSSPLSTQPASRLLPDPVIPGGGLL